MRVKLLTQCLRYLVYVSVTLLWILTVCSADTLCDAPDTAEGVLVTLEQYNYSVNSNVTFSCDNNTWTLQGPDTIWCLHGGKWSDDSPICTDVQCPQPPSVKDATHSTSASLNVSIPVGTIVRYTCDSGLVLHGPATVICLLNATWTQPPICQVNDSSRSTASRQETTTQSTVSSNTTVNITGAAVNGTETGYPPCPQPTPIQNGKVKQHENFVFYNCDHGYSLEGVGELTCQPNGSWSSEPPACTAVTELPVTPWKQVFLKHRHWIGEYDLNNESHRFHFNITNAASSHTKNSISAEIFDKYAKFNVRGHESKNGAVIFRKERLYHASEQFPSNMREWAVVGKLHRMSSGRWRYQGAISSDRDGFTKLYMTPLLLDYKPPMAMEEESSILAIVLGIAAAGMFVMISIALALYCTKKRGGMQSGGHRSLTSFENPVYEYENSLKAIAEC